MARRPDYTLIAKQKTTDLDKKPMQNQVGAAWDNNGILSVRLNVGVQLRWDDDIYLTLFRTDDGSTFVRKAPLTTHEEKPLAEVTNEEEIPF